MGLLMIDFSIAARRVQELLDAGDDLEDVMNDAGLAGIHLKLWREFEVQPAGYRDDTLIIEFYHTESRTRWLAKFSGYDAEEVEVFGPVNQWSN